MLKFHFSCVELLTTSPYMKRSVLKDTIVSDYTRAEFLNFSFYLNFIKSQI